MISNIRHDKPYDVNAKVGNWKKFESIRDLCRVCTCKVHHRQSHRNHHEFNQLSIGAFILRHSHGHHRQTVMTIISRMV